MHSLPDLPGKPRLQDTFDELKSSGDGKITKTGFEGAAVTIYGLDITDSSSSPEADAARQPAYVEEPEEDYDYGDDFEEDEPQQEVEEQQEGPLDEEAAVQPANEEPANEEPAEESHPRGQAQAMEAQQIEAQEESEDAVVAETGMAAPIVAPAAGEGGAIRGGPGGRRRKAPHRKQPCMKHLST